MNQHGEIRHDTERFSGCLDFDAETVMLYWCHGLKGNQQWLYDESTKLIQHTITGKCLTIHENQKSLTMEPCNENERFKWYIENYDAPSR